MLHNKPRLVSNAEDVQQISRTDEVEAGKEQTFCLEVFCKSFLAEHELLLQFLESFAETVAVRCFDDVRVDGLKGSEMKKTEENEDLFTISSMRILKS
jgi:hypothetical protein